MHFAIIITRSLLDIESSSICYVLIYEHCIKMIETPRVYVVVHRIDSQHIYTYIVTLQQFDILLILRFPIHSETLTFILQVCTLFHWKYNRRAHLNNVRLNYSHIFFFNLLDFCFPYTLTFVYFSHAFKFCSRSIGALSCLLDVKLKQIACCILKKKVFNAIMCLHSYTFVCIERYIFSKWFFN